MGLPLQATTDGTDSYHAYTIKDKDYFKPVYLEREFWGVIGFLTLIISIIGMIVTDNDWFMWPWVIGVALLMIGQYKKN